MPVSILIIGSEVQPFSKTGGLADVLGALPLALARLGHQVTVVTPKYHGAIAAGAAVTLPVALGPVRTDTRFVETPIAERVRFVFVDRPDLYDRESLYGAGSDYPDNPRRFGFLAKAALEYAAHRTAAGERYDILHAHDWQAGLGPVYLRTEYAGSPIANMASVFTIHNLAYQGIFPSEWMAPLGLPPQLMTIDGLEYWGSMSFMKGGINFSRIITTVSPTYAREIQTAEYGSGFEGVLTARAADLFGVLNGIDTDRWDPSNDPFIPEPYDVRRIEKKDAAQRELMQVLGPRPAAGDKLIRPVVGMISRLVDQKGFDLLAELETQLPTLDMSFAVLGTGDDRYQKMWQRLAATYPDRFGVRIGFDEPLAHLIEAAADIFLMPSRFEPCGLNQMYSMRYGTVPVVRATGGLDDTVTDYNDAAAAGTGFKFTEYTPDALLAALERAARVFRKPQIWRQLQTAGMRQDFSWDRSAREYVKLYERAQGSQPAGQA
jgi:starch synthase